MQIKEGEKVSSEQNTSGRDRGQRQETLWSNAARPECSENKQCVVALISKGSSVILLIRCQSVPLHLLLKGGKLQFDWFMCVRHQKLPKLIN